CGDLILQEKVFLFAIYLFTQDILRSLRRSLIKKQISNQIYFIYKMLISANEMKKNYMQGTYIVIYAAW
ncbi:hypothetical protein, partial [Paenibacillus solani]